MIYILYYRSTFFDNPQGCRQPCSNLLAFTGGGLKVQKAPYMKAHLRTEEFWGYCNVVNITVEIFVFSQFSSNHG